SFPPLAPSRSLSAMPRVVERSFASPTCVMRRPNGRCSLSGLVWPSPDPTSSRLQISDGVRIQHRQLLGEALATTAFRRQERDFLPKRLRPEIGRLPARRTRDSKDALEKPAVSGHFRRVSTCGQKTDLNDAGFVEGIKSAPASSRSDPRDPGRAKPARLCMRLVERLVRYWAPVAPRVAPA